LTRAAIVSSGTEVAVRPDVAFRGFTEEMEAARVSAAIQGLAARFLADAEAVDAADSVPEDHLRGLADAGLYGVFAPVTAGGLGLAYLEVCSVIEELASACLASTFLWIQHLGLLRALLDPATPAALRTALLPGAIRGEVRGGLALAGLLPGPPRLTAQPAAGGWVLDGQAPWVTGWGLVSLLLTVARGPQDTVVTLLVDAQEQPGLVADRQRLAAVNASVTVRLSFTGLFVPDSRVVGQQPFDPARQQAEGLRPNGSLALGVARRCCALIGPSALDDELGSCRAELDTAGTDAMPAARARACELAVRAAHILAVRRGSASALVRDPAERLAREASFLLVFGSRPAIKNALLGRLS
jgi:alkylation response protein AidB-like acyl-CoA dehydrogenase